MRWKHTQEGDRRAIRKFAWLPTELDDGTTVWLEKYEKTQVYRCCRTSKGHLFNIWVAESRKPLEAK